MELQDSTFEIQNTAVLAFPDTTRVAGYRAALGLWTHLTAPGEPTTTTSTHYASPASQTLTAPASPLPPAPSSDHPTLLFSTPSLLPTATFCFVTGLPAAEYVADLADQLVSVLEAHGVRRLVVPAAVNLVGMRDAEHLWTWGAAPGGVSARGALEEGVRVDDAFLSAVCNMAEVAEMEVVALVHGDKRPSGSSGRQRTTFGSEYVDQWDAQVVGALANAVAAVVPGMPMASASAAAAAAVQAEVTRTCHDVDSSAKGLAVYA
ncbi:hypothetical protein GGI15_004898 [Coemansia interrupta]|uniref:Uncharacterized protein n=1 Tax=Coemansia interrupta TaxID=1126814 RepID=A0A9W8H0V7_9FUNG|nr:hypothetical protein GGI15_004898 [Coemansia interrupta]